MWKLARSGHNAAVNWEHFGTPCWQFAMNTTPISALPEGAAISPRGPTGTEGSAPATSGPLATADLAAEQHTGAAIKSAAKQLSHHTLWVPIVSDHRLRSQGGEEALCDEFEEMANDRTGCWQMKCPYGGCSMLRELIRPLVRHCCRVRPDELKFARCKIVDRRGGRDGRNTT
jgi:hypothetical protein